MNLMLPAGPMGEIETLLSAMPCPVLNDASAISPGAPFIAGNFAVTLPAMVAPSPLASADEIVAPEQALLEESQPDDSQPELADPRQLLAALLLAEQQQVNPLNLTPARGQSGEILKLQRLSGGVDGGSAVSTSQPASGLPVIPRMPGHSETLIRARLPEMPAETTQPPVVSGATLPAPAATVHNLTPAAITTDSSVAQPAGSEETARLSAQPFRLEGDSPRRSEQLQQALGERLQVQVKEQVQHATMRLDPPDLGRLEIAVQLEKGQLQVHINASNGEVYRILQQTSEGLRQSLSEQNFLEVNVQVSSQSGQQQHGREQRQERILAAAEIADEAAGFSQHGDDSVLLTV